MTAARPSTWRTVLGYSVLRLLLFAVPLVVVYLLSGNPWLSGVVAAVIGLGLSVILLGRRRDAVSGVIAGRVEQRRPRTDESVEDAAADGRDAAADGQGAADSAAASPRP